MPYKKFKRSFGRPIGSPTVAISKLARFTFNKRMALDLTDKTIKFVELMWDKDANKIGFKPVDSQEILDAYEIRFNDKGSSAMLSAKPFLTWIGYDYRITRKFQVTWNKAELLYEISLDTDHILNGEGDAVRKEDPPADNGGT